MMGFEADITPLFRDKDRAVMLDVFDLWSVADVTETESIYTSVENTRVTRRSRTT